MCVLTLNLHSIQAAPTSPVKKLKPRSAKMPKGTVLLDDPGPSDHISCTPLQGHGGGSCLLDFDGNASHLPQAGPSVPCFPGHREGTRTPVQKCKAGCCLLNQQS